LGAL
jgi:hypothetical protein